MMLNEAAFWKIIEESRVRVPREHCANGDEFFESQDAHLRDILRKLSPDQIKDFSLRLVELRNRAYRWDLWGAAYWEGGGCSDDGFIDFRCVLVSLGKEMYENVLANPDNLADLLGRADVPTLQAEGFAYIPDEIYEELTGERMDIKEYPRQSIEPSGENWDFDNKEEVERRLPRLFKQLPNGGG